MRSFRFVVWKVDVSSEAGYTHTHTHSDFLFKSIQSINFFFYYFNPLTAIRQLLLAITKHYTNLHDQI